MDEQKQAVEQPSNPPPPTARRRRPAAYKTHYLFRSLSGARSAPKSDPPPRVIPSDVVPHGGSRSGTSQGSRRVQAQMVTARMSRKDRQKVLAAKCREAGVRSAAGLAAKRLAA